MHLRLPLLRTRLLWVAVGSLLPVLGVSVVLSWLLLWRQDEAQLRAVLARNQTLITTVDAVMNGHLGRLRMLAASPILAKGDLAGFAEFARRVHEAEPDWRNIILVDEDGIQHLNLRSSGSTALPHEDSKSVEGIQSVLATGHATVGDVGRGPLSGLAGVPLRVPLKVDGKPMVLMAILDPHALATVLSEQQYPANWILTLADSSGRIIARQPPRDVGELVSERLRRAIAASSSGTFIGRTLEGVDSQSAFVTSAQSHWVVATGIPMQEVLAPRRQAAQTIAIGIIASLAIAFGIATWLARRVAGPVSALAEQAKQLANGAGAPHASLDGQVRIREVRQLADALDMASTAVRAREDLMLREQELMLREQEVLRSADHAKDEFIAMMGHELRNPLSAIAASAHLLTLVGISGPSAASAAAVIERQVRHMTRLIEQLLDVSRLALRELNVRRELVDLASVVAMAVSTWAQSKPERLERVHVTFVPTYVMGDPGRLEQVVVNLLDNAEKFSAGHGDIRVNLARRDAEAVLEVSDQGRGIAPADLQRIFEPFVQGEQGTDRALGGLGLGLALVHRIVTLHDGHVSARSGGIGQGATLEVRLPACPEAVFPAPTKPSSESDQGRGKRVLLAEDNDDAREMLQALLTAQGHDVAAAPNGSRALQLASEFRPEVAFIDIGLPDMDGHAVAAALRRTFGSTLRIVALTGYGQPDDRARALQSGFDLHFVKPVSLEALEAAFGE